MATQTQPLQAPAVEPAVMQTLEQEVSLLEQAMSRPLAQDHADFEYALRIGEAANDAHAGLAENTPQAAMKILFGKELGLSPIVSLSSIFVIKERTSCSGALVAAILKRAGFSWSFVELNQDGCTLAAFLNGKPLMERWIENAQWLERQVMISFTREDADRAKLTKQTSNSEPSNYDKYGADMYYNRCIMRLQRRYAPELTHGIPLYTPDEVDGIEAKPAPQSARPAFQAPQRKAPPEAPVPGKPQARGGSN